MGICDSSSKGNVNLLNDEGNKYEQTPTIIKEIGIEGKAIPNKGWNEEIINKQLRYCVCKINQFKNTGTGFFVKSHFQMTNILLFML